ncbi:MAG: PAS domain-containing protein [Caldilineaceae bacterium]
MSQTDATWHDAQTELTKARQRIAELEKQPEQARSVTGVEYQRLLIDSIPDALFILSYDETTDTHQVVDVNESTCNLLGYERDELLKLTIQDIDDPASPVGPPDMFELNAIRRLWCSSGYIVDEMAAPAGGSPRSRRRNPWPPGDHICGTRHCKAQGDGAGSTPLRGRHPPDRGCVIITEAPEGRKPHVLFANQAFTKITGYTLQALEQDITILQLPGTNSGNNDEVRRCTRQRTTGNRSRGSPTAIGKRRRADNVTLEHQPHRGRAGRCDKLCGGDTRCHRTRAADAACRR